MKAKVSLVAVAVTLVAAGPAAAWGDLGHEVTGLPETVAAEMRASLWAPWPVMGNSSRVLTACD